MSETRHWQKVRSNGPIAYHVFSSDDSDTKRPRKLVTTSREWSGHRMDNCRFCGASFRIVEGAWGQECYWNGIGQFWCGKPGFEPNARGRR